GPPRYDAYELPLIAARRTAVLCPGSPGNQTGELLTRERAPAPGVRCCRVRDHLHGYEQCRAWGYNLPKKLDTNRGESVSAYLGLGLEGLFQGRKCPPSALVSFPTFSTGPTKSRPCLEF